MSVSSTFDGKEYIQPLHLGTNQLCEAFLALLIVHSYDTIVSPSGHN